MSNQLTEHKTGTSLAQIVEVAELELSNIDHTPFSEKAFRLLKEKVSEYTVQLITEATKVARRHQSEQISTSDVQHAAQYLVASTSRKMYRHVGTIGGILMGTAASNVLAMITTNQYTLTGVIITFILTLIGTFLIAAHIVKD